MTVTPDAMPTDNGSITNLTASAPGFTGAFSVNPSTGVVTISNAAPAGSYTVTVTATDNCNTTSTKTFNLIVNGPPTMVPAAALTRQQDSPAGAAVPIATVSDDLTPVGNLSVIVISGGTATGISISSITNISGAIKATVAASCGATSGTVRLQVTDGGGLTSTANLQVNVTANAPPMLAYATPQAVTLGTTLTVNPTSGPSDNGGLVSFAVQSMTPNNFTGTITVNSSGVVSITNAGPGGSVTVTIRATDHCGATTDASFTLSLVAMGDRRFSSDFDGDGKADLAIWRASTATFLIYRSTSNSLLSRQWGVATDVPVPGDYDGDGKTDIAVWRPSTGTWMISNSSNGATITLQWGNATDVPVPGDYDGDGKTDLAIWRPSTGTWMIFKSSNGSTMTMQWGTPGDVPVPGDYDGDGKTDLGIWRPATATFWIYRSASNSTLTKQWGVATDVPVPGDYDGDGQTDLAVWRASTGVWMICNSSNGATVTGQWGNATDVPAPGDYDGDGKTDLAIWRPSTGAWWIFKSTGGTVTTQCGTLGDVPVR